MINNIKKLAAVVALATSFVACSTKLDINVDPNNATLNTATPSLVLPSALMQASNIYNTPVNALSYIVLVLAVGLHCTIITQIFNLLKIWAENKVVPFFKVLER
jgi:hypothetical protein